MKRAIKRVLQAILGLKTYLFLFAWFKIATLHWDRIEGDFMRFLEFVPDSGHVLDIGANIGIMTVLLARRARNGTIHAFEPMPVNYTVLERVVARSGLKNVVTYPWALGETNSTVEMVMPFEGTVALHGLSHVVNETNPGEKGMRAEVSCWRLDDLADHFSGAGIAAIKIDVEGFESAVLAGAQQLLARYRPPVYCEIGYGPQRELLFEMFRTLNYSIQIQIDGRLSDFDPVTHSHKWNFFLLPNPQGTGT